MNRRRFMKYLFIFTAVSAAGGFLLKGRGGVLEQQLLAEVKIKKYIGRIRPMGLEIGVESRWLG